MLNEMVVLGLLNNLIIRGVGMRELFNTHSAYEKKNAFEEILKMQEIPFQSLGQMGEGDDISYCYLINEVLDPQGIYENFIDIIICISDSGGFGDTILFKLGAYSQTMWRKVPLMEKLLNLNAYSKLKYYINDGHINAILDYHPSQQYRYNPEFFFKLFLESYLYLKKDYLEIAEIAWGR